MVKHSSGYHNDDKMFVTYKMQVFFIAQVLTSFIYFFDPIENALLYYYEQLSERITMELKIGFLIVCFKLHGMELVCVVIVGNNYY